MKLRFLAQILAGVAIACGTSVTLNSPSYAEGATFYCEQSNGVPTTFVRTQDGKSVPIIHWVSHYFNSKRLTPVSRCQQVTRRFQSNYDNGTLKFIKAGILNGQPVVCAAPHKQAACTDRTLLFTLINGSDPDATARKLFDRRALAAGNVVNQSGGNTDTDPVNIDVEAYLYFAPSTDQ